jgi:voltage-dependent anion channel protein 2
MIPPKYSDLGKAAKDLFDKNYNYGFAKVDLKTTANNGVAFTTKGSSSLDSGSIDGSLETKYKPSGGAFTLTEKWSTDNKLSTEVAVEDQVVVGSKVSINTTFSPNTGKKSGALKTSYARDNVNLTLDTDFNFAGPTLQGSSVFGYEGWLAGYQFAFDTASKALTKSNFALGYDGDDLQALATVNDASEFTGSVYQKVKNGVQLGVQLSWDKGQSATRFGVASKYAIDSDSSVHAKVNNCGQIGVGYSHKLREGVTLTLSSLMHGTKLNEGGHKLGLGVEFSL